MRNKFEMFNEKKTNPSINGLVFAKMKEAVLGKDYDLSLAFIGRNKIRKLNKLYRGADKATDILSFPLSDKEGEIFICEEIALKEGFHFGRKYENFIKYLFIHGLIHLKGLKHSSKMESEEKKFRDKFGV